MTSRKISKHLNWRTGLLAIALVAVVGVALVAQSSPESLSGISGIGLSLTEWWEQVRGGEVTEVHKCPYCGTEFETYDDLQTHINTCPSKPSTPYTLYVPPAPTPTGKAPTSITAMVSPNPMRMCGWVYGDAITDGYSYSPIYLYAKHLGSGETTKITGTIGPDGKCSINTQLNTPGYWEFWAECNGVKSNVAQLTVQGIKVDINKESYWKDRDSSLDIKVYSHYIGTFRIYASRDGWATETYILTGSVKTGGYSGVYKTGDLDSMCPWSPKSTYNWEFTARISGDDARNWNSGTWCYATWWVAFRGGL